MRIAIPVWNGRVSPVFDAAHEVAIFDVDRDRGTVSASSRHRLAPERPAETLSALGVDLLICSAVSPSLEALVWVNGIEVIADVCGPPPAIAASFAEGDSELDGYRSPGSAGGRRRATGRPTDPPSSGTRHAATENRREKS
jgi:predicted Fe-Mo cluster-binding NifX family protein